MLRIKFLRLSSAQSQWHLAQATGMSQGRYSMIERGLIEPTDEERDRLARILNAPASTLFRPASRVRATNTAIAGAE
jgi:transcriptional regulator with XRE-family HTH domain